MKMISKIGAAVLLSVVGASSAYAIPSFARQTGLSCDACHAGGNYVNLTQVGRQFKLNGYTMGGGHTKMPLPLAAMIQVQYSSTSKGADGVQSNNSFLKNNQVMFPQMSIFYGGKIYGHVGAFIQSDLPNGLTTTSIHADNTDIRYANHTNFMGDNLIYGVSLNNGPTGQDVYASTPVWGYPWASSGVDAGIPGTQIGALAGEVVGLTAYAMYDNFIYLEAGGYQDGPSRNGILKNLTFNVGPTQNSANINQTVNGTAPYARIAFQKYVGPNFFMLGGYGMKVNFSQPGTTKLDKYTDVAIDGEYQYIQGKNTVTVAARNTWENQTLNGSHALGNVSSKTGTLSSFSGYGAYTYNNRYIADVGYHHTTSTGAAVQNSGGDSSNYIAELAYLPVPKIKVALMYEGFLKVNGKTDAADTTDYNTLSLGAWFMF